MAWSCTSEPPRFASGSKTPLVRVAKRVTVRRLPPPIAGAAWHVAHERSLNTGPRPSATLSISVKSPRPSAKAACCAAVRPGSASPACGVGCGRRCCASARAEKSRQRQTIVRFRMGTNVHGKAREDFTAS